MNLSHQASDLSTEGYVDINLIVLGRYLAESWRLILISVLIALTFTAFFLRNATPAYQATMVVAPMDTDSGTTVSQSMASQFLSTLADGGAASGGPRFDELKYRLTSPSTIHAANADGKLFTWLYGSEWNPRTRSFRKPTGILQSLRGSIRRFFRRQEWYPQDDILTSQMLSQQVDISTLPKSTLTVITYSNPNPVVAAAVLGRLLGVAEDEMRSSQRATLKAQIGNANEMLAATQLSDLRMAMSQQLATSQFRLMNVPISSSANDVQPAFVAPVPISPKPAQTLAIVFVVTLLVSGFAGVGYRVLRTDYDAKGKDMPVLDATARAARRWLQR
jgi:capsular polysaccharide biosynthesis protein